MLLFLTLCLQVGYSSAAKKLSVDVGGAKRLHALSTLIQGLMLGPWALLVSATGDMQVCSLFCSLRLCQLIWHICIR